MSHVRPVGRKRYNRVTYLWRSRFVVHNPGDHARTAETPSGRARPPAHNVVHKRRPTCSGRERGLWTNCGQPDPRRADARRAVSSRRPRRAGSRSRRGGAESATSETPSSLSGSSSAMSRRSTSMPSWACTAAAMSDDVTDPKSRPPSPARASIWIVGRELVGDRLRRLPLAPVAGVAAAAHRVGLLLDARGRAQREPARHEEVAGVAVGDVDEVALLADVLDVGAQHDLHHASSPSSRSSAIVGAVDVDRIEPSSPNRRRSVDSSVRRTRSRASSSIDVVVELLRRPRTPTATTARSTAAAARRGHHDRRGRGGPSNAASPDARCTEATPSRGRA